jgi:chromosome segregation ATPase
MKAILLFLALTATGAAAVSPLGKVFELLDELAGKITKEGEAEAKSYKEYFEWCDDAVTEKGFEIKTATSTKEGLEAEVAKQASIAGAATPKIEELVASIAEDEAELKKATAVRAKEAADFSADETELLEVIDTLSRAIGIVEKEMASGSAAFAQVDTSNFSNLVKTLSTIVDAASFPSAGKRKLLALVQDQQRSADEDDDAGAPAAAVFKSSSGSIVDVLEDLKEKAEEQLSSLRKAEGTALHNYSMLKQSLEDSIGADSKALDAEKATKIAAEEAKATAEGDLAEAVKVLADGEGALETIRSSCMREAADHEATVTARTEELKVIAEAKSILTSSTSGAASETYSLLQMKKATSQERAALARNEVVVIVKRLAKAQKSAALAQLASRIVAVMQYGAAAGEDPFTKVKELITGLITKLEDEAASAADEKAYCDEQMSKTEAKKAEVSEDVEKLTTKIDQASAKSTSLKEEVKTLEAELAALAKSQATLDEVRATNLATYTTAKAELEEGLTGVRNALGVLRDYYGGASAASMLQDGSDDSQPAPPESHVKKTGAGDSIISILEVVESDFAKNLATVETEEADEVSEYEKVTQENKVTKTVKDQGVKYKTQEYKALDKTLTELAADLESKEAELSAILEYYEKIKGRCIAKAETYEERKAKREAEIAGLKEALSVLENETAFVQRRQGRRARGQSFLGVN